MQGARSLILLPCIGVYTDLPTLSLLQVMVFSSEVYPG